jgi:hypothetical protein
MRERKTEVEQLKQRISELEGTARQGATFDAVIKASSSTSANALGTFDQELNSPGDFGDGNDLAEYTSTVGLRCRLRPPLSLSVAR